MDLHLYQIAVTLVSAFMIFQGLQNYIKGKQGQTFIKLFVRVAVWGGMAMIAIYPKATNILADIVGLKGNINAVILVGFIFIFLMIFKLLSAIEKLEQQITEVTREKSLKEIRK